MKKHLLLTLTIALTASSNSLFGMKQRVQEQRRRQDIQELRLQDEQQSRQAQRRSRSDNDTVDPIFAVVATAGLPISAGLKCGLCSTVFCCLWTFYRCCIR